MKVDTSKMTAATNLVGDNEQETTELEGLTNRATEFISSFEWCRQVHEIYVAFAVPAVVGVFLVRIAPAAGVDHELWVIVGDLPPAYLVTDDAPTAVRAIETYIELMQEWIDAVKAGGGVEDLIPVNAQPTHVAADMLQSRLNFLSKRILSELRDEA